MKQTLLSTHPVPPLQMLYSSPSVFVHFQFPLSCITFKISPVWVEVFCLPELITHSFTWEYRKRQHKLHVIHKDEVRRMPSEDKTNYCGTFWGTLWTQVISYHFMLNLPEIYFMICFVAILELRHSSECEKLVKNQWKIGTGVIWVWF